MNKIAIKEEIIRVLYEDGSKESKQQLLETKKVHSNEMAS
jgi:hypothetical protein